MRFVKLTITYVICSTVSPLIRVGHVRQIFSKLRTNIFNSLLFNVMTVDGQNKLENNKWWNNYNTYKFLLWTWMMNEISVVAAPVDLSHTGFYIHLVLYTCFAIFVGIPLVYSEICIAQYTNCDVVSTWNFCPILRSIGYGTFYLVLLKLVYNIVLASWYLEYSVYATFDPPPWFSCDDFDSTHCMVKRINVSIFQRCIEAQTIFNEDCGKKTASSCFYEREIEKNNTKNKNCFYLWKPMLATFTLISILFIMTIKKEKVVKVLARILALYVFIVSLVMFFVAVSSSGAWYTRTGVTLEDLHLKSSFYIATQGVLACGTGTGIIGFLSRDVYFRSPCTRTAVTIPLFSIFITLIFGLILFSAVKTVSYYHGAEQDIIEVGGSIYFNAFASVSEILSYFDGVALWGFTWFSTVLFCLFMNIALMILFLLDHVHAYVKKSQNYKNVTCFIILSFLTVLSCPFYCSDLTLVLADVTEIIQLTSNFFFSVGIYWIYGFHKHNVDIIFMIGVKASYFWKIAWITNPIWNSIILYMRWKTLLVKEYDDSFHISPLPLNLFSLDVLLFYFFFSIYALILVVVMFVEIKKFYIYDKVQNIFSPLYSWGPKDKILFKSRNMFVPEIMTREFLYRQIRIHGYSRRKNENKLSKNNELEEPQSSENHDWSALTSN